LDSELVKVQAENKLLRRENENQLVEIRKLQGSVSGTGDKVGSLESEKRRIQAMTQVGEEV